MDSIRTSCGKRIKDELDKRSWTRAYFAQRLKTNPSNVTLWIQGKTNITLEVLAKIAREFGMEPYELLMPLNAVKEQKPIFKDDALLRVIEELGYERPKRLRKADK